MSNDRSSMTGAQAMTRDTRTCFGAPGSIDAARLFKLPLPMQAEGVRLLFEMGQTMEQVTGRLGLSARQILTMLSLEVRFARMGEHLVSPEGK